MRTGHLHERDWASLRVQADLLKDALLVIDDTFMTFATMAERCRRFKGHPDGLAMVVVDDLQQLLTAEYGAAVLMALMLQTYFCLFIAMSTTTDDGTKRRSLDNHLAP
jgi:replicative DNA helicase